MLKIGFFGGTFNPVHNAHLIMAKAFSTQMELDKCLLVPAFISPFKTGDLISRETNPAQRLEMLKLALQNEANIEIEDFEITRNQISFSIDTVNYLIEKYPGAELYMLIGTDQALAFEKWKNWEEIINKVQVCITQRPEALPDDFFQFTDRLYSNSKYKPKFVHAPIINITSTLVRDKIRVGESVSGFVPNEVEKYIMQTGIYK